MPDTRKNWQRTCTLVRHPAVESGHVSEQLQWAPAFSTSAIKLVSPRRTWQLFASVPTILSAATLDMKGGNKVSRTRTTPRPIIQVVPGQAGGGSFKIETLIAFRAEQRLCLQVTGKPPGFAAISFWFVNLTPCLLNVESLLISSDLIASQLLLEIVHCIPLSPQSVSSHLISTHLISCLLSFFNLISSHPMSCPLSLSQLFSADHNCSHLFSCDPELFSCDPDHVFTQQALHREAFTQQSLYTQRTFTHRSFYTEQPLHRNLYTEKCLSTASFHTKKPLHRKVCTQRIFLHTASLYTVFTHSKPSHREAPTQKSFYTEKFLYTASLYTEKFLHAEVFCTQPTFTQRSP